MRVAVLVPRRDGIPERDALWRWCRAWWEAHFPDWPIVEGHHNDGPFNRAAAINRAADLAGDWDVALVIDSDAICDPGRVREAVEVAARTDRLVLPFRHRKDLTERGTRAVMDGWQGSWDRPRLWQKSYLDMVSTIVAVSRRLWEATGGFDEGFRGWGWEDNAFAALCETFGGGPVLRIEGDAWHLYHAPQAEVGRQHPLQVANRARFARYEAARGDPAAMRAIRETEPEPASDGLIPRIIHRVVPEATSATSEAWWARFGTLHPGWQLMTHRDPLDPADWPITSPAWGYSTSGATLADLVRLEALFRWGGFYVDSDVEPLRSLDPLRRVAGVVAAWEDERVVPNAVLAAPPEHPAIRECLTLALRWVRRRDVWKSGPGVTTRVLAGRSDVVLLPPGAFYGVHYRDPDRAERMRAFAAEPPPWAYGLHWYAASWTAEPHPLPEVEA